MELEITWSRVVVIWWSLCWRNLIAIVLSMIVGAILGFFVGFILAAVGFPVSTIQIVTGAMGFIVGLAVSVFPLKMILGKDFGEFRLVLLAKQTPPVPSSASQQ